MGQLVVGKERIWLGLGPRIIPRPCDGDTFDGDTSSSARPNSSLGDPCCWALPKIGGQVLPNYSPTLFRQ